ncbi:MAG TPA: SRPBCC family protein [Actinomycetes bacterium]|nr:SRPBCC family protein [Actinomycetes bacterium]
MQIVHDFVVPQPIDTAWNVLTDLERIAPCMPGAQLTEVEGDTYRGTVKVKVGPILAQFRGEARFKELDTDAHRAVIEARGKEAGGKGLASALITAQLNPDGDRTAVNVVADVTLSGRIAQFGRGTISEISTKLLGQFVQCLEETVLAEEVGGAPAAAAPTEATFTGETAAPTETASAGAAAAPTTDMAPPADTTPPAATAPATEAGPSAAAASYAAAESGVAESAPTVPAQTEPAAPSAVRRIDAPEAQPVNLLASAGPSILKRLIPAIIVLVILVVLIIVLVS